MAVVQDSVEVLCLPHASGWQMEARRVDWEGKRPDPGLTSHTLYDAINHRTWWPSLSCKVEERELKG